MLTPDDFIEHIETRGKKRVNKGETNVNAYTETLGIQILYIV